MVVLVIYIKYQKAQPLLAYVANAVEIKNLRCLQISVGKK